MRCPSCGATITERSRFCPHCGVSVADAVDAREAQGGGDVQGSAGGGEAAAPGLQPCPACGADNSRRRTRCGRCGAHLTDEPGSRAAEPRTPETPDVEAGDREDAAGADDPDGRPRVRPALLVVALAAIVGTAVGAAVLARDGGDEAAPVFDPTMYREDASSLDVERVSASSTLPAEGSIRYQPELVADDDPTTAWNEGADRAGIGEELVLTLPTPAWIERVSFRNGYQKDELTFFDNARVRALRADFDDGSAYELRLADHAGVQAVELPVPALTRSMRLEILSVYAGDRYEDLAISEIDLAGWTARGRDRGALEPSP